MEMIDNQTFTVRQAIAKVADGRDLSRTEARQAMAEIMEGQATAAQIGSLITALRMKGETAEEITGFAELMRLKANRVNTEQNDLLDTCGTGGDGAKTFNISTASALVAAAGGIRVAKHGNRAMSSASGSADVLEALGVNIYLDQAQAAECLSRIGICFLFAQTYHGSMKHAAGPRKELGIRTVFNLLGPLTNPAGADRQLLGLFDRSKTELIAEVMRSLGVSRGLVVGSLDGLDEISVSAPTKITELRDGSIATKEIAPEELGLGTYELSELAGGDAAVNAEIIRRVLKGERGAARDVVLANAGACFYVAGRTDSLRQGVVLAEAVIDSGRAAAKLAELVACTREASHVS
ncbi:anthranilate phosphoribosyltransferase [Gorillibacterium timonense]|uniref:anthranilate phosphoribosyltransferase n=1 Tax=Gorillibacterium timonense TaxID=1689269 RepID=UPI000A443065